MESKGEGTEKTQKIPDVDATGPLEGDQSYTSHGHCSPDDVHSDQCSFMEKIADERNHRYTKCRKKGILRCRREFQAQRLKHKCREKKHPENHPSLKGLPADASDLSEIEDPKKKACHQKSACQGLVGAHIIKAYGRGDEAAAPYYGNQNQSHFPFKSVHTHFPSF